MPCTRVISTKRYWGLSLLVLIAVAVLMVACSNPEAEQDTPAATQLPEATKPPTQQPPQPTEAPPEPQATEVPTSTTAPKEAPLPTSVPTAEPTATSEPTPEIFPLEIRDMLGRPVTIPASPARIVSISPTATEMLYAVGGSAVARDSSSTFPDEVMDLPDVGGAYSPSLESIAAQRPDLILIEALTQARFLEPLSQFGAPVVAVRASSLDDIAAGIRLVGQIIESDDAAEKVAQDVSARVASAVEELEGGKSALILISDADRNLYVAKPQSYPGAIATMVKLSNPAAELPDSGTFPGFALVSAEQLLTMDPDFLFTITPAPEPVPRLSTMLPRIPGLAGLRAVGTGQMHEIDHVVFLRNQGPRIAEAVEMMAELVGGTP